MKNFCRVNFAYEPTVIFQKDEQWTHGREPVLRRMPDGSLTCLIYSGGKREPDPGNLALIVRSNDDGRTWTKPEIMFKHDSRCTWPTEIFTEGPRPFAVIQTFQYNAFYTELRAFQTFTDDNGKTWSEPQTIKGTPPNFCVRQGKVLSNGEWLFPVYWMEQDGGWNWPSEGAFLWKHGWRFSSGVIRSCDQGKTFTLSGYLHADSNLWEPEVIELEPGHLLMFIRCCKAGVLWKSESFDFGANWSPAEPTDIPNPGTKLVMFKVDGKVVLVSNMDDCRRKLSLWVSSDSCRNWDKKLLLAEVPMAEPDVTDVDNQFNQLPWICYPHGFVDEKQQLLYLALDSVATHFLVKIPFSDFLS